MYLKFILFYINLLSRDGFTVLEQISIKPPYFA